VMVKNWITNLLFGKARQREQEKQKSYLEAKTVRGEKVNLVTTGKWDYNPLARTTKRVTVSYGRTTQKIYESMGYLFTARNGGVSGTWVGEDLPSPTSVVFRPDRIDKELGQLVIGSVVLELERTTQDSVVIRINGRNVAGHAASTSGATDEVPLPRAVHIPMDEKVTIRLPISLPII